MVRNNFLMIFADFFLSVAVNTLDKLQFLVLIILYRRVADRQTGRQTDSGRQHIPRDQSSRGKNCSICSYFSR